MKCVLDIGWSPKDQKSGAEATLVEASPYVNRLDVPPHYTGGYASIMVFARTGNDSVQIDGTIESIREVLEQGLESLALYEEQFKKDYEERARHAVQCTVCNTWFDPREGEGHADGKGGTCLGWDGEVSHE